ncbi:DUF6461 domain-containing protein [Streptomyces sp. SP17BM10]|uniref:DUF6461 domain-containing protein n=1 Tax=Streptomyces sp. SP17BM10 TaxID=3002530 RepID=UPI002E79E918|nr:DUF6461 domain-containing protein [Streptomyces sp. SP17BM10]MEE1787602.1 DUF6461 domain-containing protein [Streptomyces sp. SP17BM10]
MTAHATDFTWFAERYPVLGEAYCLTHVQGLGADELLRRFDAAPGGEVTGLDAVVAAWETFDDGEDETAAALFDDHEYADRLLVAVTELDGWALAVEPYGYLGSLPDLLPRLADGTRAVSHFRNVNAVDHFNWWEGATCRLQFEPLFPDQRHGTDADAPGIPELLTDCGFRHDDKNTELNTESAFALAERLTDVRIGADRLEAATFRIGYARRP